MWFYLTAANKRSEKTSVEWDNIWTNAPTFTHPKVTSVIFVDVWETCDGRWQDFQSGVTSFLSVPCTKVLRLLKSWNIAWVILIPFIVGFLELDSLVTVCFIAWVNIKMSLFAQLCQVYIVPRFSQCILSFKSLGSVRFFFILKKRILVFNKDALRSEVTVWVLF